MSNSQSLVVALRPPGNVSRIVRPTDPVTIHGHPDWLGLPDVLYDVDKDIMIGLVFPIVGDWDTARLAISKLDSRFARLRDSRSAAARELYFGDDNERWLEVAWADTSNLGYLPAQLAAVHFDFESDNTADQEPISLELLNCDVIADELGLQLPQL